MNAPTLPGAPGGNCGGGEAVERRAAPTVGLLVEATNAQK